MASTSSTEASRGAHELMPPGEILSLEGAGAQGAQGTHRVDLTEFFSEIIGLLKQAEMFPE